MPEFFEKCPHTCDHTNTYNPQALSSWSPCVVSVCIITAIADEVVALFKELHWAVLPHLSSSYLLLLLSTQPLIHINSQHLLLIVLFWKSPTLIILILSTPFSYAIVKWGWVRHCNFSLSNAPVLPSQQDIVTLGCSDVTHMAGTSVFPKSCCRLSLFLTERKLCFYYSPPFSSPLISSHAAPCLIKCMLPYSRMCTRKSDDICTYTPWTFPSLKGEETQGKCNGKVRIFCAHCACGRSLCD